MTETSLPEVPEWYLASMCASCGEILKERTNLCPKCGELLNWRSKRRSYDGDPRFWLPDKRDGRFNFYYIYPYHWQGWNKALRRPIYLQNRGIWV